jgi:LAO/AO transport system kinase
MSLMEDVLNRDIRAGARLLRWIDDGVGEARSILKQLYSHTGKAAIVGITGNPGAGKSTLVDQLITRYRAQKKTVAVVAVDPSSPFSGGAILGDRIRMQEHALDEGVFIRSFATRGHLGGLTGTTADVVHVFDAMGWDLVLVETVGVGQDEVEVQRLAHTTVVVMAPGMGDEIQAIKAGILEIADIFAVNKSDRDGADRTVRELRLMLDMGKEAIQQQQERVCPPGWMPRVIKTVSTKGEGIDELMTALAEHRKAYENACRDPNFVRARLRREFLDVFRRTLFTRGWSYLMHEDHLKEVVEKLQDGSSDPYTLAKQAVNALGRL